MKQIKFLHFADLHLDAPFTSLGGTDKARTRRQELKACLRRIVTAAAEESVDFLFISGDLYEHEYTDKATINFIADEFRKLPETRILIIPGNHDPYTGNSFYRSFQWPENVHILAGDSSFAEFEELGTCVYSQACIPALQSRDKGFLKPGWFNILMLHGTLDIGFGKNIWNPFKGNELESLGVDYIALGHFHTNLQGGGAKGILYNPGSPEPMGFDETGEHGVFIGTLVEKVSGEKTKSVIYQPMNIRKYIKLDVSVDGYRTEEQIIQRVMEQIRASGSTGDLYEVRLKGYTDESMKIDEAYIAEVVAEEAFYARVINESLPGYDFRAIAREPGIRGLFTRKLLDRIDAATTEKDRLLSERALIYGLQAMDSGRPDITG